MMGKATSARRKVQLKERPPKWSCCFSSPQQRRTAPLGPRRRGPEGEEVEEKGRILKEAPESTRKRLPDC
jgi:hypothetical protein